jgi:hypothetical protein
VVGSIDIGKAVLNATVRVQGDRGRRSRREVRNFGATAGQLLALRDWDVTTCDRNFALPRVGLAGWRVPRHRCCR